VASARRRAAYRRSVSASDVVARQAEAYNAHDLEGFLACFAPDVVIRSGDGTVLTEGIDAMRTTYDGWFQSLAGLRAETIDRVEHGPWVVDKEHVTAQGLDMEGLLAYRVRNGLIDRVVMMTADDLSPGD